jgi:hypothetical protein
MHIDASCFAAAFLLLVSPWALGGKQDQPFDLREGDIVFSSSRLGQGEAIIAATASPYTHCGIVFVRDGKFMVLEAVQPVGVTTIEGFMSRGNPETFTARRLKTTVTAESYHKARAWAEARIGRHYDARFTWDDDKLYCSELVWKIYQQAGVRLCALRKFRDYDLRKPEVKRIIDQRYGGFANLPLDESVVAPSDIAASPLLIEVPRKKG